jgi:hypothetical protein
MGAEAGTDGKHAFPVMAAPSKQRRHMNQLTTWDQLIELFQNEPEVHLDIEADSGTHMQPYRLHNGKQGEDYREFYAGTLDTSLEDHKGDVIYADEIASGLLTGNPYGFRDDLASVTDYKSLVAGIK